MATKKAELETGAYRWPEEGLTHIPDWIYTSDEIPAVSSGPMLAMCR
jgi:hypothetical protein